MNRIYLEEYVDLGKVKFYTIRFEENEENETDKFIDRYLDAGYLEDIQIVRAWMQNLGRRGARHNNFRFEKNAYAGPIFTSNLRIYCIRCHDNTVILDGGGPKEGNLAQDGEETKKAFDLMNKVDFLFREKIKDRDILYESDGQTLTGELYVDID